MKRPALIFDFGNVVANFDYRIAAGALGRSLGLSAEETLDLLRDRGLAPLLQRYESGKLTSEEFSKQLSDMVGLTISHPEFLDAWSGIFTLNEATARLIERLRSRGYTLILGSNTNEMHANWFLREYASTVALFDRLILSYEVGSIKPSPEFYHACARAAGLPPEECVFIDDLLENVEGARQAGLVGLLFRDTPSLAADLRRLGVDVEPVPEEGR